MRIELEDGKYVFESTALGRVDISGPNLSFWHSAASSMVSHAIRALMQEVQDLNDEIELARDMACCADEDTP